VVVFVVVEDEKKWEKENKRKKTFCEFLWNL
jgi:hypothetical protein